MAEGWSRELPERACSGPRVRDGERGAGVKTERLLADGIGEANGIARAAALLREGGLVAFPTETVYGLGANALDAGAVAKIFQAKERPGWDPLIVHVEGRAMLERVARMPPGSQGRLAAQLMEAFWPGPLTLLLPRTADVPDAVTAGRPLVGVRMPAHPVARELIRLAGVPVAAPSANRFGHTSPTTAAHVLADLDGRIDAVLDGGATAIGVESTVVGPDPDEKYGMLIYRPGGVTMEMLKAACGAGVFAPYVPPGRAAVSPGAVAPESLPSPGVGLRHYAPQARLVLVKVDAKSARPLGLSLVQAIDAEADLGGPTGVMLPDGWNASRAEVVFRWGAWGDTEALARLLFSGLRALDERGVRVIVCPVPEMGGLGEALRDRLEKAARPEASA
jgi:L-threonylcarbamoyladenylate synthase